MTSSSLSVWDHLQSRSVCSSVIFRCDNNHLKESSRNHEILILHRAFREFSVQKICQLWAADDYLPLFLWSQRLTASSALSSLLTEVEARNTFCCSALSIIWTTGIPNLLSENRTSPLTLQIFFICEISVVKSVNFRFLSQTRLSVNTDWVLREKKQIGWTPITQSWNHSCDNILCF